MISSCNHGKAGISVYCGCDANNILFRPQLRRLSTITSSEIDADSDTQSKLPKVLIKKWDAVRQEAVAQGCWSPSLLLRSSQTAGKVSQVQHTLALLTTHIDALDPSTLTLATLHIIDRTAEAAVTCDLRLMTLVTDYVLAAAGHIISHDAAIRGLAPLSQSATDHVADMLTLLAFRLTPFGDARTRSCAVAMLEWVSEKELHWLRSRLFGIFCGFHTAGTSRVKVGQASSVPYRGEDATYDLRFWDLPMWRQLKPMLAETENRDDVLLVLAALIRTTSQLDLWMQTEAYFEAAAEIFGDRDTSLPVWQYLLSQYFASLLRPREDDDDHTALDRLTEACDSLVVMETAAGSAMLWKEVLYAAGCNPAIPAEKLVDLLRSSEQKKARPHPQGRFHIQRGPPHSLLEEPVLYEWLSSGLTSRFREIDAELEGHLATVWELAESCDVKCTAWILQTMLYVSVSSHHWLDVLRILACFSPRNPVALNDLRKALESCDLPMKSANPVTTGLIDRTIRSMDASEHARFCRNALDTVMHAIFNQHVKPYRSRSAYAVWLFGSRVVSPQSFLRSLSTLVICGTSDTQAEVVGTKTSETLWDGLLPSFQARSIFRELLFAQHPELANEDILAPLLESAATSPDWDSHHHFSSANWEACADVLCSKHSTREPVTHPARSTKCASHDASDNLPDGRAKASPSNREGADDPPLAPDKEPTNASLRPRTASFEVYLFQVYMAMIMTMRFHDKFATAEPWREPLNILAWMRYLGVPPSKYHLCDLVVALSDSIDNPSHLAFSNEIPDGSLLGPLWPWCKEWIPIENVPSEREVLERWLSHWNYNAARRRQPWY